MTILQLSQRLCASVTGSQCSPPRMSTWQLVDPGQATVSVDVADVATGGITAVVPANVKVYGSCFTSGLERKASVGGTSAQITGYGVGVGAGAGWGVPFVGASVTGKVSGLKRSILEKLGGAGQGKLLDLAKGSGWGGGTGIVAGPDTHGDLTLGDFEGAFATIIGLGANFVVNGVTGALILFGKRGPIISPTDVLYVKGIGLMAGVGLAISLDVELSGMVYRLKVGA